MVTQKQQTDKRVIYIWRGTARAFLALLGRA